MQSLFLTSLTIAFYAGSILSVCVPDSVDTTGMEGYVGAPLPIDLTQQSVDREITLINEFLYNQTEQNQMIPVVSCVKSGTKQVVAGFVFKFKVTLAETNCAKSEVSASFLSSDYFFKKCQIIENTESDVKTFRVYLFGNSYSVQLEDEPVYQSDQE